MSTPKKVCILIRVYNRIEDLANCLEIIKKNMDLS